MNKFLLLIGSIKEKLFGKEQKKETVDPALAKPKISIESAPADPVLEERISPSFKHESKGTGSEFASLQPPPKSRRDPYFIQIGLDFGTSYSKCICRDVMTNKAWVHIPPRYSDKELPFLIPSAFLYSDGKFQSVSKQDVHYPEGGLYHLKNALVQVALGQLDDHLLKPYRIASRYADIELRRFVESCAVYFLAGVLGTVREQIRQKRPDFGKHQNDYLAVNLAVPVADAERPLVNSLYTAVLCEAWSLADELHGHPLITLIELESLRQRYQKEKDFSAKEACFIYPEVSANVQGFVRSRVSLPGIYLFSDTGAGTVDQSTFIFWRSPDNSDLLTFLHGKVLACGSSHIEFNAASKNGRVDAQSLESWRKKKEHGGAEQELTGARHIVAEQLSKGTRSTLAYTKKKLFVREQLEDIRVIFGGGGHCDDPYKTSVLRPFSGDLFRRSINPDVVGLPIPTDLDSKRVKPLWMKRLSVAYGLSFEKSELAEFIYPKDVENPEPDQIWRRNRKLPEMVTNDQM